MLIVKELKKLQDRRGYLTREDMRALAERIREPTYRLHEVASFFPHFRIEDPPPKVEVHVCRDMTCHLRGSNETIEELKRSFEGRSKKDLHIGGVSCLGRCDRAPCAFVASGGEKRKERLYVYQTTEKLKGIVDSTLQGDPPAEDNDGKFKEQTDVSQWKIDPYRGDSQHQPYAAVRRFADGDEEEQHAWVQDSLRTAGLLGMGGAGGRAFKKWNDVFKAVGDQKYIVCNCDESEPGTFKDREIMLQTPHLIIEGMCIAGLIVGATQGYVYVRHEYEEEVETMDRAIEFAKSLGVLGEDVLGSGKTFHLETFTSPGGYICGEQTALINAMESRRGEPRNRPPELQTNGLFDKPTVVNNVETLAWVPAILLEEGGDGQWYKKLGMNKATGRRIFSISGDLVRPGVYEVPIGITLGELINDRCGGLPDGKKLKGVALSGPSGGITPAQIPASVIRDGFQKKIDSFNADLKILDGELKKAQGNERKVKDIESQKKRIESQVKSSQAMIDAKVPPGKEFLDILDLELDVVRFRLLNMMGGGGMVVYGDQCDVVQELASCLRFFRNESCGKCVPCRLGSQKLVEISEDLIAGKFTRKDIEEKKELVMVLSDTMKSTAICGLGTVAPNPLVTMLEYFMDDVEKYLKDGKRT